MAAEDDAHQQHDYAVVMGDGDEPAAKKARTTESLDFRPPPPASDLPRGKVLFFENASATTNRNDLIALCARHGDVGFVDFRYGETTGYVRFKRHDGAHAALAALSGGTVEVGGATPSWRLLTAEESAAYNKRRSETEQRDKARAERQASKPERVVEKGVVLRFEGAATDTNRNDLMAACTAAEGSEVAFVDFKFGDTSGSVRFKTAYGCMAALRLLSAGTVEIGGQTPTWRMLTEEEEEAYRAAVQSKKPKAGEQAAGGGASSGAAGTGSATAPLEPSMVIRFEGTSTETSREDVSEVCGGVGAGNEAVAFVDFRWGDSAGYVRFRSADAAKAAAAALSASAGGEAVSEARGGKMEGASWRLLSDVEAEEYREAVAAKKREKGAGGGFFGKGKGGRAAPKGWGGGGGGLRGVGKGKGKGGGKGWS